MFGWVLVPRKGVVVKEWALKWDCLGLHLQLTTICETAGKSLILVPHLFSQGL